MAKQQGFGIGNLQVPDKYKKEAAEDDTTSEENASTDQTEDSSGSEEQASQNVEEDSGSDEIEEVPDPMYIGEAQSGPEEVELKCGAHACIFNQQGNCRADKVEIGVGEGQGNTPRGTYCKTFQTPNQNNED